jgi:DNA-binding MarR family transcriptional regulator
LAAHGISVKEFDVLITLFNAPGGQLRMTDLAEQVLLTPSGVNHLVTRLERDGLVSRSVDKEDRRSTFAALTSAGHRRLRESRPDAQRGGPHASHAAIDRHPARGARSRVGDDPRVLNDSMSGGRIIEPRHLWRSPQWPEQWAIESTSSVA